jgi:2'-5' RNA ligase
MARRLFVALEPPEATRPRLVAAQQALHQALGAAARQLRWAAPATLHLTLRFLGDVEPDRVPAVEAALEIAAAQGHPLALEIRGAGAFPEARHPRALFLDVGGDLGPLRQLVASLEAGLVEAGFAAEPRPFRPHLTVARARERRGAIGLETALAAASVQSIAWPVGAVTLFESHLEAGGARHEAILVATLGGGR